MWDGRRPRPRRRMRMTTLHRCRITWLKGPHPCWRAQKALDDAGVPYTLHLHPVLHRSRDELEGLTGKRWAPALELDDGSVVAGSKEIARRAADGSLGGEAA